MWYPTNTDLVQAGVVTAVTEGDSFAISGVGAASTITVDSVETELQKQHLYRALKGADSVTYAKVRSAIVEALQQGKAREEMHGQIRSLVGPAVTRAVPYGSDAAILAFAHVMIREIDALRSAPGRICVDYLNGGPQSSEAARYFSADIRAEEDEASAGVLETALPSRPMPPKRELERLLNRALDDAHRRVGDDLGFLAKLNDPRVDPVRACRGAWGFYTALVSLPPSEAALALRGVLGDK
jgi:hypothetical protein